MSQPRKIETLLSLLLKLGQKESMKIDYILNNLSKVSNLHNLSLSEDEKRVLRRYQNKNFGQLKMPNNINSGVRPKFEQ